MTRTLQTLLCDLIDYAGLFPPAKLEMGPAAEAFNRARMGEQEWMLGRFICPLARLAEFEKHAGALLPGTAATSGYREHDPSRLGPSAGEPWRVSVLLEAPDLAQVRRDVARIHEFNDRHSDPDQGLAEIDMLEVKVTSPGQIDGVIEELTEDLFPFFEFPVSAGGEGCDCRGYVTALAGSPAGAKIRTGGVVPGAFPTPREVASFLHCCSDADVPFKATAGLHHPVRASHRLTYEPSSPNCTMHGFLNLFIAAALVHARLIEQDVTEEIIADEEPDNFRFCDEVVGWRERLLDVTQLALAREGFAHSFGSCSFDEPIADLAKLKLL